MVHLLLLLSQAKDGAYFRKGTHIFVLLAPKFKPHPVNHDGLKRTTTQLLQCRPMYGIFDEEKLTQRNPI